MHEEHLPALVVYELVQTLAVFLHELKEDEGVSLQALRKIHDEPVPLLVVDQPQHLITIGILADDLPIDLVVVEENGIYLQA